MKKMDELLRLKELYEERAAIYEYEAGLSKDNAESLAKMYIEKLIVAEYPLKIKTILEKMKEYYGKD